VRAEADIQASVDQVQAGPGGDQGPSAQELKDTCMKLVSSPIIHD